MVNGAIREHWGANRPICDRPRPMLRPRFEGAGIRFPDRTPVDRFSCDPAKPSSASRVNVRSHLNSDQRLGTPKTVAMGQKPK